MSKEGGIGAGEYRYLSDRGRIELEGSVGQLDRTVGDGSDTRTKRNEWRGHLKADGGYDFNENWRAKASIYRASDDTSLRKLDFDDSPTLRSRSEEHTSELQSLMRTSYDVFCLKKQQHT